MRVRIVVEFTVILLCALSSSGLLSVGKQQTSLDTSLSSGTSVASPTILLLDLQLFQLLRQLIYHIRSRNCFLCLSQAYRNRLIVFVSSTVLK